MRKICANMRKICPNIRKICENMRKICANVGKIFAKKIVQISSKTHNSPGPDKTRP